MSKLIIEIDDEELPVLQIAVANHRTHLADIQTEPPDDNIFLQQYRVERLIEAVYENVMPQIDKLYPSPS